MSLMLTLVAAPYLVPTGIAAYRDHPGKLPIFLVNLFLGWTVIGWKGLFRRPGRDAGGDQRRPDGARAAVCGSRAAIRASRAVIRGSTERRTIRAVSESVRDRNTLREPARGAKGVATP